MKKIQLWQNKDEISENYALVDEEDYERVIEAVRYKSGAPGKWYAHDVNTGGRVDYIYAVNGKRDMSIHRVVMQASAGMHVDHINGDRLDNRKQNLRICTRSENSRNKKLRCDSQSGFKGVYYAKNPAYEVFLEHGPKLKKDGTPMPRQAKPYSKPWRAYIGDPANARRHIGLGYYATAEEAARAYDEKAIELHGEYAYTNFPREEYE